MQGNAKEIVAEFLHVLAQVFGNRVLFAGLQGSYARGEASGTSDIDFVVILDKASPADHRMYHDMLGSLAWRDKACGFMAGQDEILCWDRADLFSLYHDTQPLVGSLEFLLPTISTQDVRRAVHLGACNLYHACGHNVRHGQGRKVLRQLYKSVVFVLRARCFDQSGHYVARKAELAQALWGEDRLLMQNALRLEQNPDLAEAEFDALSDSLLHWSAAIIRKYCGNTQKN